MKPGRRERHPVTHVRFRMADLLPTADPLSVPLLRLMAAANDARQAMKQIIRAERGGRKPGHKAETAVQRGQRMYLEKVLCGHVEEALGAFAALWNHPRTRRRLRKVIVLHRGGREALDLLTREIGEHGAYRERFLRPVRNDWAFHYRDSVYRTALAKARKTGEVLVAQGRGFSRYLVTDDLIEVAMHQAAGGTEENYDEAIRIAIQLGDAIGKVVDGLLLGLLDKPELQMSHRTYVVALERALARGQREAAARRRMAADRGS